MALDTPFFGPDLLFNIFEKLNFGILWGPVICELCKDHKTDCELKDPSDFFLLSQIKPWQLYMPYTFYTVQYIALAT